MAETRGYTCDRPQCGKFQASTNGLPAGWLALTPSAAVLKATGEEEGRPSTRRLNTDAPHFDLCSNYCVAQMALERCKANGEQTPGIYRREPTQRKTRADAGKTRAAKAEG